MESYGGKIWNKMSTTTLYAALVIIPKHQDNSITAAVAMITIN
jgi:hypothetical protein